MKKVLLWILVILLLAGAAFGGWYWYRETHIFVEDAVYAKNSKTLDLRGTDISLKHFDTVHAQLPDCEILWDVPFQGKTLPSDTTAITLKTLTEADIERLSYFPNLNSVDTMGCSEYALLEQLGLTYPNVDVAYEVSVGTLSFAPDTASLTLKAEDFDFDTLMTNLPHLPQVASIRFEETALTPEQLAQLGEAFPEVELSYSVALAGQVYEMDVQEADLSAISSDEIDTVLSQLELLPGITTVQLMNSDGTSNLSLTDVQKLQEARPDTHFLYSFTLFGHTLSTDTERVEFKNQKIGDEAEEQLRQALDVMDSCTYFLLDNCRLSNEVLAQLREDYRGRTKIVWRIWFGEATSLTDAEIIRSTYNVEDDNCHDLVYCEDVRFIDFGHNEWLDGCEFIRGMPNLEFIILSGAPIKSLEPFENCKKLRILEIAFCMYITDLTPLAGCESLEMLNIGETRVQDLSPLDDLNLTMLMASGARVPAEEQQRFAEVHPDCWASYKGNQYGSGWRYDEDDKQLPWYKEIAGIFGYPKPYNNLGWYLKKED